MVKTGFRGLGFGAGGTKIPFIEVYLWIAIGHLMPPCIIVHYRCSGICLVHEDQHQELTESLIAVTESLHTVH